MRIVVHSTKDFWFGLFVIAVGIAVHVSSVMTRATDVFDMGPSNLPVHIATAASLLGLVTLIRSFSVRYAEPEVDATAVAWRGLAVTCAAIGFLALFIDRLGLFAAALGLALICGFASMQSRWIETVIFALGLATFVVLIFVFFLGKTMPVVPAWQFL